MWGFVVEYRRFVGVANWKSERLLSAINIDRYGFSPLEEKENRSPDNVLFVDPAELSNTADDEVACSHDDTSYDVDDASPHMVGVLVVLCSGVNEFGMASIAELIDVEEDGMSVLGCHSEEVIGVEEAISVEDCGTEEDVTSDENSLCEEDVMAYVEESVEDVDIAEVISLDSVVGGIVSAVVGNAVEDTMPGSEATTGLEDAASTPAAGTVVLCTASPVVVSTYVFSVVAIVGDSTGIGVVTEVA